MKRFVLAFAVITNLVFIDAIVKRIAEVSWKGAPAFSVLEGFFDLRYVENRGCAWGMFQGQVWPLAVFGIVALAFLIWRRRDVFGSGRLWTAVEWMLYAGIIGNVIDRVTRGYVVDMFDFHWHEVWHFPCFNVADTYISVGAFFLILLSYLKPKKESRS